jgi:site-specific recombinase XerD
MLGHAEISTTQIYLHLEPQEARETHARCHPSARGPG